MVTVTASRHDTPAAVLSAAVAFGLLLGRATYTLHGTTPPLERATNSVSTWILRTAVAGAPIRTRGLATWSGGLMMLATCAGYCTASGLGDTFGSGGLKTAAVRSVAGPAGGPLLVPQQATFAPSRRSARTLAAPGTSPSTSSTRACARHAESTHRTPLLDGQTLPAAALGRAGWTVRQGQGDTRAVAGAAVAMVVLGEGLWLGLTLHHWAEAGAFLAAGALLTALLTVFLARAGVRRFWWCAALAPAFALVFYLAGLFVLDRLIGSF